MKCTSFPWCRYCLMHWTVGSIVFLCCIEVQFQKDRNTFYFSVPGFLCSELVVELVLQSRCWIPRILLPALSFQAAASELPIAPRTGLSPFFLVCMKAERGGVLSDPPHVLEPALPKFPRVHYRPIVILVVMKASFVFGFSQKLHLDHVIGISQTLCQFVVKGFLCQFIPWQLNKSVNSW